MTNQALPPGRVLPGGEEPAHLRVGVGFASSPVISPFSVQSRDVSSVALPSPLGSGRREGLYRKRELELSARGPSAGTLCRHFTDVP